MCLIKKNYYYYLCTMLPSHASWTNYSCTCRHLSLNPDCTDKIDGSSCVHLLLNYFLYNFHKTWELDTPAWTQWWNLWPHSLTSCLTDLSQSHLSCLCFIVTIKATVCKCTSVFTLRVVTPALPPHPCSQLTIDWCLWTLGEKNEQKGASWCAITQGKLCLVTGR